VAKQFYGKGIPGLAPSELRGTLIAIEGGDGAGRSTQVMMLKEYLERRGFPVIEFGLKRSNLVGKELGEAMEGNSLGPLTFSLFYATDFADQLETTVFTALRAGFVVIADRYIFTPMARDIVRGAHRDWCKEVYGFAPVPDIVIYLKTRSKLQAERIFEKSGVLGYWESGMDIQRSGDMYQCFVRYQDWLRKKFDWMAAEYRFDVVDGNRDPRLIHAEVQERVAHLLEESAPVERTNHNKLPKAPKRKVSAKIRKRPGKSP